MIVEEKQITKISDLLKLKLGNTKHTNKLDALNLQWYVKFCAKSNRDIVLKTKQRE